MKMRTSILLTFLLFLFKNATAQPSPDYKLVFADEFDGPEIDGNTWWQDDCSVFGEWLNDKNPAVTLKENVVVENGVARIIAKNEKHTCIHTSSPRMEEHSKNFSTGQLLSAATFQYGYFEIKAKVPKGNGFWPAYWFHSSHNNKSYQEIDVFEFCGCNCEEFQAGIYFENDGNDVVFDRPIHQSVDIPIDDACKNFHLYGVEWTPEKVRIFFDGRLVALWDNVNIHGHMNLILGMGVNSGGSCEIGGSCRSNSNTVFPAAFEIDYVRVFKKDSQTAYFIGENEICHGGKMDLKAPVYPGAAYTWSTTPGLTAIPHNWYSLDDGIWRIATIKSHGAGPQQVTLTIDFPSGYSESKTLDIAVREAPPAAPAGIELIPNGPSCCYGLQIDDVSPDASGFSWTVSHPGAEISPQHFTTDAGRLSNRLGSPCFKAEKLDVTVVAENACGSSEPLNLSLTKPLFSNCKSVSIVPNPAYTETTVFILGEDGSHFNTENGRLLVLDFLGRKILDLPAPSNPMVLDLSRFVSGTYAVTFVEGRQALSAVFVKMD
jgi:beta-glucanase (GH16 family)